MGVEVGGNFGDLFEDLESFVFEVDGAEADGLELAQDAGDFAGFAAEAPLAGEACADPAGQEADAHVVDDALGLAMEHGADLAQVSHGCPETRIKPRGSFQRHYNLFTLGFRFF